MSFVCRVCLVWCGVIQKERKTYPWNYGTQQPQVELWENTHFNLYWKTLSALGTVNKDL